MKKMTILIEGMTCQHCVKRVTEALNKIGIEGADVEIGKANIVFDENKINLQQIAKALSEAGYKLKE